MQYLLLVYTDPELLAALPAPEFDREMKGCLEHADALAACGTLLGSQQLDPAEGAKSVRSRQGQTRVVDGPFAETKEVLAGFNLVEAASMAEALRLAQELPWTRYGCVEVRAVRHVGAVRARWGVAARRRRATARAAIAQGQRRRRPSA